MGDTAGKEKRKELNGRELDNARFFQEMEMRENLWGEDEWNGIISPPPAREGWKEKPKTRKKNKSSFPLKMPIFLPLLVPSRLTLPPYSPHVFRFQAG